MTNMLHINIYILPKNVSNIFCFKTKLFISEPKGHDNGNTGILSTLIPVLFTPFLWQTIFLPFSLIIMKVMIAKSILLGKLGLLLWVFTYLKHKVSHSGNLYSHNVSHKDNEGHKTAYHQKHHSNYEQYYNANYERYNNAQYDNRYASYQENNDNSNYAGSSGYSQDHNNAYYSNYGASTNNGHNFGDNKSLRH